MSARIIEVKKCEDKVCPYFDPANFDRGDYCFEASKYIKPFKGDFPKFCPLQEKNACKKCDGSGWKQDSYMDGIPTVKCTCPAGKAQKGKYNEKA